MQKVEHCAIGRGKGIATNVPERPLIEQVRIRPLLYDKSVKDYRKPGATDIAWNEIATVIDSSVPSCKKRWKSLRDTFIKYFRLETQFKHGEIRKKPKSWNYYHDLIFLKDHVELFRLEESVDSFVKDGEMTDNERQFFDDQEDEGKVEYEIRIAGDDYAQSASFRVKHDHLLESYEEVLPEADDEYEPVVTNDEYLMNDASKEQEEDESQVSDAAETFQPQNANQHLQIQNVRHIEEPPTPVIAPIDPDESYWSSRFEAFKRLSRQQKAYVRMGIEKLLYEAEFENVGEPQNKRSRIT